MMSKRRQQILNIVERFEDGATVRDVLNALGENLCYTTILKHMQIMCEKGMLEVNKNSFVHKFKVKCK